MREGLFDDGTVGALLDDALPDGGLPGDALPSVLPVDPLAAELAADELVGEIVVRDGIRVRIMPEDLVPGGALEPFDEAWYRNTVQTWGADASPAPSPGPGSGSAPEAGSVRPPAGVPVVLWPEASLRQVLAEAPGAQLSRVVAEAVDRPTELDPDLLAELSDDALGDLVAACGRLQSWAAGVQARVVAERCARESHPLAHNSLVGQVTGELVVTEKEATEVVVRAEAGARHPSVIQALTAGRIDVRKAHTLLRSASQLTDTERAEAIRLYLPRAPRRTWKWLQARMLAFAKARHGAARAAKAAAERRGVQVDRADDDMGWLSAYLPATDAAAVWGVVDDMAHQLRHVAGEDRTLGQLRADSLTGIVTGRLLPADRFTDSEAEDKDEDDDGPETGTRTANSRDANDADHGDASDGDVDGVVEQGTDAGTTGGETPICTCGGRGPVVQQVVQEVVRPVRITPTRPVIHVTIPATALLGLDDAPGHLNGYGPIPAETARTIAQDATWRRLLTDPVTGILTDYSTTAYQPGKVLRTAVETRDGTCMFLWGCGTPASRCDLDHIEPFGHDTKNRRDDGGRGQTNAQNLHALCRKHHLLKTHGGWGIVRDPATGVTTWTTPTGRTHTRPPTVLDAHIDLDQIDPDTSQDLTLRALTGQRLPQQYDTTEPGSVLTRPTDPIDGTGPTNPVHRDEPPF